MASASAIIPVGYKQTEVGVIPEDWLVVNIDSIAEVKTGAKDTQDKVDDGVFPFFVRSQKVERINSFSFDGEAVLTAGDGVGTGKIFHYIFGKFDYHQRVYCMSGFSNCTGKFFYYQFSTHFYDRIMSMTAKSSVDSVRRAMITQMQIPLPPDITEQDEIAGALSDSDSQIQALENLITKKRDLKQGTMQELLTAKTRLPGFASDWIVKNIIQIAPLQRGFDLPSTKLKKGAFPVVYSNGIMNYHNKSMVKGPGVITGRSGTLGVIHYIEEDFWPHNTTLWVTNFNNNNRVFVYYLYIFIGFNRFGSGSGVPTLNRNDAHSFLTLIPSDPKEQEAIAEFLSDMDAEIAALEQRLEKTKAIKQGMMQQLLTGRIRLVEPSTPVEASA